MKEPVAGQVPRPWWILPVTGKSWEEPFEDTGL